MDKYEYKVRADEIKELIARGEYAQAADIADTIDWRRVKSVRMLCTISDLYKINRRYEDAKNMLLLAYERRPGGRTICYSLCELSIKTEEFVQAVNYYKEYVQVAPKDPGRYILQYKLYEAQDVSLEERIGVLEELKKRDYREKWAYELAYLYHRVGLATRCVEECDEMILWFGDGKYVIKAMELKMLHQPLSPEQQERYDNRFYTYAEPTDNQDYVYEDDQSVDAEVPNYDDDQNYVPDDQSYVTDREANALQGDTIVYDRPNRPEQEQQQMLEVREPVRQPEELDIQVKTMDMGKYNTINLQAELAAGLREVLEDDRSRSEEPIRPVVEPLADTETLDYPQIEDEDIDVNDIDDGMETVEKTEVFFGETGEIGSLQPGAPEMETALRPEEPKVEIVPEISSIPSKEVQNIEKPVKQEVDFAEVTEVTLPTEPAAKKPETTGDVAARTAVSQPLAESSVNTEEQARIAQPPKELAGVLSQESDGQISLVIPEQEAVEKQITGQMSINDILTEWEAAKKKGEERRKEEVRQRVLRQTGDMFTEFEASVRDGLLEKLESAAAESEPVLKELDTAAERAGFAESEEDMAADDLEILEEESPDAASVIKDTVPEEVFEELDDGEFSEEEEPQGEAAGAGTGAKEAAAMGNADSGETEDSPPVERDKAKIRQLTREEKELFGPYIQSKADREQLVKAIDNISMASYTGNVIITGDEGMDTATLAKNIIREIQMTDSNFSGKVAKISGHALNRKDVAGTLQQLKNGSLIIRNASGMQKKTAMALHKALQGESLGIIVVMEDTKKAINKLLEENEELGSSFTSRIDVQALSNDTLVAFGRQYAREIEYSIDELGVLALHTRIEEMQTIDHAVTVMEVKGIVDEAVHHANRKTLGHFVDILLAKRYDEEDMIILTEKDFA